MTLVRWSPMRELDALRREVDSLFDPQRTSVPAEPTIRERMWSPRTDVRETDDAYLFEADLPGLNRDDIEIQLHGDTLTLRGERKVERSTEEDGFHRVERAYGTFYRSFTLATPVDADGVTATYKNGVLEVRVPKAAEAKPKKIEVLAS